MVEDGKSTLWIVLGTVGLVLLIACANVANLFLVRADSRQKEMAVRAAMGAGRSAVASSFLSESLVLGAIGGVVGVVLAWIGVAALVAAGPAALPRLNEIGLSGLSIGLAAAVSVLASLTFGAIPLTRYAGGRLADVLRDGGRANTVGRERHRMRNVLVASQLALALVLLVGSGLMLRSFGELRAVDPGFDPANVMTISMNRGESGDREGDARFYQSVADQVAALPGVEIVGTTNRLPLTDGNMNGSDFLVESRPEEDDALPVVAMYRAIGPGYFESMGVEIVAGRDIDRSDVSTQAAVLWVNETLANSQFGGDALGERLRFNGGDEYAEIVGVIGDTKEMELTEETDMQAYVPMLLSNWATPGLQTMSLTIKVAEGQNMAPLVPAVRDIIRRLDPDVPLTRSLSMEEALAESMAATSFTMVLLAIATGVAVFLSAIGLFGVISYVVGQRTREIGLRIALGAGNGQVRGLVLRQVAKMTAIGGAVGLVGAFFLGRAAESLLFGLEGNDPFVMVSVAVILSVVAFGAGYVPAARASRVDPMVAMRAE